MVNRMWAVLCLLVAVVLGSSSFAAGPDRVVGDLSSGPKVQLSGNLHGLATRENDIGRADSSRQIERISLNFRPSAAQQADLDHFLAELADRTSPNYHKYLTTTQFASRFGMSKNDINKVVSWIESLGFTNVKVAGNRNEVVFDGTIAQIESAFALEMHHYLVNGEIHLANATNPSVPMALSSAILYVGHLNDFSPKPRLKVRPNFTSYVSGNHSLTPADFATIYDLNSFYTANPKIDGTGQKIAVVGQSTVATSDLNSFRSAAGLPASTVTMTLMEGTAARCSGDESESDLDLEWSGGIAKNASITFVYAGLGSGDACGSNRVDTVWDALNQALTGGTTGKPPVAPFVSTSYGFCEQGLPAGFPATVRTQVQNGQALGVTLVGPAGDSGAADCDTGPSATQGLAVDVPASIPETTGAGGTEFSLDSPTFTTNNPPGGNPPYWAAASASADTISSALEYIPEMAWNDTPASIAAGQGFAASGGGSSTLFAKPTWQSVAPGTMRGVPDVAFSTSADHDPYLFCSEDDQTTGGIVSTCTDGFRTGAGGGLTAVGGTSAAAPTFTAMLALINQYLGSSGLAPVNPSLYAAATSTPAAFNDIKTGNNLVPCTTGTPNCPSGTTQIGFSAGTGYDLVTGLGSVNGFVLAQALSSAPGFTLSMVVGQGSIQVAQGLPGTAQVQLNAINGFTGAVTYTCTDPASESTCTGPTSATNSSQVSFSITTTAPTAKLRRPFDRGERILYATLFPGLLGVVFVAASGKRSMRGLRVLGLVLCLGFSTLWLGSCGGSSRSTVKDPGTPVGTYTITVTGTATINNSSVSRQTTFQLVVVQ